MGNEETGSGAVEGQHPVDPEIEITISDRIRQIGNVISKPPFDKEAVFRRGLMFFDKENPISPSLIPGFLAEMHVASALERWALKNPGAIDLNPILNGDTTDRYLFERTPRGSFTARERDKAAKIAEYDKVIKLDQPVVIEARTGFAARGANKPPGATLWEIIKPDEIKKRLAPLCELFGGNQFGFIVVASPEAVSGSLMRQTKFEESGVLLVPMPMSISELEDYAQEFSNRITQ